MYEDSHDVKGGGDIDNGAEIRSAPQTNRILHLNYFFLVLNAMTNSGEDSSNDILMKSRRTQMELKSHLNSRHLGLFSFCGDKFGKGVKGTLMLLK